MEAEAEDMNEQGEQMADEMVKPSPGRKDDPADLTKVIPTEHTLTDAEKAVIADQDALAGRLKIQLANATLQLEGLRAQHQALVQRTQQQDAEVQQRLTGLLAERGVNDPMNWSFDFKTMKFTRNK